MQLEVPVLFIVLNFRVPSLLLIILLFLPTQVTLNIVILLLATLHSNLLFMIPAIKPFLQVVIII